ncbi:MAG: hypothetical protein LUD48_03560 [Prevotella sp.]|nr:hypothetical protein [Prevotella sp.]
MTYIEYMNQLWRSAQSESMPSSEIALYAYLVNECNIRYWKMPVPCPSQRICAELRISKQTLVTARESLARRNLINYIPGRSRFVSSRYVLLNLTDKLTVHLTEDLTHIKEEEKDKFTLQSSNSFLRKGNNNGSTKYYQRRGIEESPATATDYEGPF